MDCCTCFAKFLLSVFNFASFFAGALVFAAGLWLRFDRDSLLSVLSTIDQQAVSQLAPFSQPLAITIISYFLMAFGGFVFIVSCCGYCGAIKESKILLGFYGFLVVTTLLLEITAVCLAFVYKDKGEAELKSFLTSTIKDYHVSSNYANPENEDGNTATWNAIMIKMSCCGVNKYTDFAQSENFTASGYKVPPACCKMNHTALLDPNCPKEPKESNSYYLTGCYPTLMNSINDHLNIVIYCIAATLGIELITAVFAFCICKKLEPIK